MTAPANLTKPVEASPPATLEQRLRFIDICFECAAEAKALYPSPNGPCFADEMPESNPLFGPAYSFLRIQAMHREGLPLSLLGDGKTAHERHREWLDEREAWARDLRKTPVRCA